MIFHFLVSFRFMFQVQLHASRSKRKLARRLPNPLVTVKREILYDYPGLQQGAKRTHRWVNTPEAEMMNEEWRMKNGGWCRRARARTAT
jgi:hypothetical protein